MADSKPVPSRDEIRWAWEIHKDADANLHGRLNAFVSVQAFLFAGFALLCTIERPTPVTSMLIVFITIAGCASSIAFWIAQQRILAGIEFLKSEFLVSHDEIYERYFSAKETVFNRTFDKNRHVYYVVARRAPWAFVVIWACLILGLTELRYLVFW